LTLAHHWLSLAACPGVTKANMVAVNVSNAAPIMDLRIGARTSKAVERDGLNLGMFLSPV
jgi:hypothetical protein